MRFTKNSCLQKKSNNEDDVDDGERADGGEEDVFGAKAAAYEFRVQRGETK